MLNVTVEDCLELLTGLNKIENYKFELESSDYNILTSVARQVFKGVALTDRQYDMLAQKLEKYTTQFEAQGIDLTNVLERKILRNPFREVDRTQRIYIDNKLIVAQFPFNKKLISKIQKLRDDADGQITNNENKWKFELSEGNVLLIGKTLDKFEFSNEFQELFDQVSSFVYEEHVPGIYKEDNQYVLKNVHPDAIKNVTTDCGPIDSNVLKYVDRRNQYGIVHCDVESTLDTLEEKIAYRKTSSVYIPDDYSIDELVDSIETLGRYPVLVVADETNLIHLYEYYNSSSRYVPNNKQSVMFRLSNETQTERNFNQWVKDNKLNNWVDNTTKIVYINASKVPKPVLKNYDPQCLLNLSTSIRTYGVKQLWLEHISDLRIFYATKPLAMRNMDTITK